ncbi:MAG: helix-turn-helix domain-containing protein [Pseudomonadota bacterium]|nr:helix-turn-helix domain-containing protein [Pseudomonadota bacterium]
MIAEELRQAIGTLKDQGRPLREISRALKVSRNTVRRVLRDRQHPKATPEDPRVQAIAGLLPDLYRDCKGNVVRIGEILKAKHAIAIPYSTLTRLVREQDLRAPKKRSGTYTFGPGEEMQHDTSAHRLSLGEKTLTGQCASLVLAYSRMLFIQYYPRFTRFEAKAFLTEALRFFDGACPRCVIDNTSVVLAGGSGPHALIAPEMEGFGALFGMAFMAHAIGHSDRKGRVERPFSYVEGNFLAGRTFADWADLNAQARAWCEEVANAKVKRVLGMSPQAAYAMEKAHLLALPAYIPPVTEIHYRVVDCYGFVHLDTNRYSVPERLVGKKVAVHKRPEQVLVFCAQQQVAEHPRLIGQRQGEQRAKGHHTRLERRRAVGPSPQEQALTGCDPVLDRYVVALKKRAPGRGVGKLRRLLALKRTYPSEPFLAAVAQALQYGLFDLTRLERLILERVAGDFFDLDEQP